MTFIKIMITKKPTHMFLYFNASSCHQPAQQSKSYSPVYIDHTSYQIQKTLLQRKPMLREFLGLMSTLKDRYRIN